MACFVAPTVAAIIATAVRKKVSLKYHFDWLLLMLWGGVIVLVVDHLASGELILRFPFLTRSLSDIVPEIIKVGIPMTIAIFSAWIIMVFLSLKIKKPKNNLLTNH
ncbi:MAG: hypothetical protein WC663_02575 [Patescibacteria group bacterium]|jgi:hypothetical protein